MPRALRLSLVLAAALLLPAAPARAQLGFNATLASDMRVRGLTMSDGRPTLSLGASYDHPSGVYAGASVMAQNTYDSAVELLGFKENLGYAWRANRSLTLDIGADNWNLQSYNGGARRSLQYAEIYVGAALGAFSAHLYYSPDYFRPGNSTLYATVGASWRPADNWRLYGDVGALDYLTTAAGRPGIAPRYDARIGVARALGAFELRLEGTAVTPPPSGEKPAVVTVSASYFF